jgi:predicted dithiol-disulfide oxidoreductase (DUF899 family)
MPEAVKSIEIHPVVSHREWIEARTQLMEREKEFTHRREELAQQRRELPWERVDKEYSFEGPQGKLSLSELFAGRSQLVVYHFMFGPDDEEGCPHCSFWADSFDGNDVHLNHRDVSFVVIARAPLAKIQAFKKRMGWHFNWVSSAGTDFNYDFDISYTPDQMANGEAFYNYTKFKPGMQDLQGISVFYRDPNGDVFHTYSAYSRGIDMVNGAYQFIDLVPKGRDEAGHDNPQYWVRHHDKYDSA